MWATRPENCCGKSDLATSISRRQYRNDWGSSAAVELRRGRASRLTIHVLEFSTTLQTPTVAVPSAPVSGCQVGSGIQLQLTRHSSTTQAVRVSIDVPYEERLPARRSSVTARRARVDGSLGRLLLSSGGGPTSPSSAVGASARYDPAMRVTVRPPRAGDEAQLGPLHNHVWLVAYAGLMPAEYLQNRDDAQATERWARLIAGIDPAGRNATGWSVLVGEVEDRLVGFLIVGPGRDPGMSDGLELMSLHVHPDLHGAGVAQQLTAVGLPEGASYLWVLDGNRRAQAFYRKLGYQLDGASKPHTATGAIEVRMVRG